MLPPTCLRLALAVAFASASVAALPAARAVDVPTLSLSSTSVAPDTDLIVSGQDWTPNLPVQLQLQTQGANEATTSSPVNGDGTFGATFHIPADTAVGSNRLLACQGCDPVEPGGRFAGIDIQIIPPVRLVRTLRLVPSSAAAGEAITASGEGWDPQDGEVRLFPEVSAVCDPGRVVAAAMPDPSFAFSAQGTVPVMTPGTHVFMAAQCFGSKAAFSKSASFTIAAAATIGSTTTTPSTSPTPSTTIPSTTGSSGTSAAGRDTSLWRPLAPFGWIVAAIVAAAIAVAIGRIARRRPGHDERRPQVTSRISYRPSQPARIHERLPTIRHDTRLLTRERHGTATSTEERR